MLKKLCLITTTLTASVLFIIGCNKSSPPTQPPPDDVKKDTIKIDIEYVTLKSVHLRLTAVDIKIPNDLN